MIFGKKEKKAEMAVTKKKKKNKAGKVIGIAIVVAALGVGGVFAAKKYTGGGSAEDAVYVQKVADLLSYSENTVTRFSGVVENQKAQKIEADISKKIEKVYVEEGQTVKTGDKLFEYSVESMELEIEQAEIEIEKMKNSIVSNESQIEELSKARANATTTADYLSYDAEIQQLTADNNSAKYDIKLKEAELKQMKNALKKAAVTSPMDGIIKTLNKPESLNEENSTLMTIQSGGDVHIKGKVNEVNIDEIYSGQTVVVRSRIHEDETWTGTVDRIVTDKTSGSEDSEENENYYSDMSSGEKASSYDFYVNLDSTDGLMMGQHITIEPDFGQGTAKKTGIWLSSGYLILEEGEEEGEESPATASVWKDNGRGRLTQQEVTLGEYDADMDEYEILEGLSMDDLIAWPDENCKSGAKTTDTLIWNTEEGTEDGIYEEGVYEDEYTEDISVDDVVEDKEDTGFVTDSESLEENASDEVISTDESYEDEGTVPSDDELLDYDEVTEE